MVFVISDLRHTVNRLHRNLNMLNKSIDEATLNQLNEIDDLVIDTGRLLGDIDNLSVKRRNYFCDNCSNDGRELLCSECADRLDAGEKSLYKPKDGIND